MAGRCFSPCRWTTAWPRKTCSWPLPSASLGGAADELFNRNRTHGSLQARRVRSEDASTNDPSESPHRRKRLVHLEYTRSVLGLTGHQEPLGEFFASPKRGDPWPPFQNVPQRSILHAVLHPDRFGRYIRLAPQSQRPDRIAQSCVKPFHQRTICTFETNQEDGVREVVSRRHGRFVNLRAVCRDDLLRRLVIALGHSRPVVTHAHGQACKWLQIGPVLAVDSRSGAQESNNAGLARLLPGITLIKPARGPPRLHGPRRRNNPGSAPVAHGGSSHRRFRWRRL